MMNFENVVKDNLTTASEDVMTSGGFVEVSYRAEDAQARMTATIEARNVIKQAIDATHGDMTKSLVTKYERINMIMNDIIDEEVAIMRRGR